MVNYTYTFDALNRMSNVTDSNGKLTQYSFDENGNQTRIDQANGTASISTFDALNRITTIDHLGTANQTLLRLDYSLDPTGRRAQITESTGRVSSYSYDPLYRLTAETIIDPDNGNHAASYIYDAVSNRVQETVNGVTRNFSYDANDRLLTAGADSYNYDDNGSTISETVDGMTATYSYNSQNRLVGADKGGSVISMVYDPDGIRVQKSVNGEATDYLIDSNRDYAQVVYEQGPTSDLGYTFGLDLVGLNTATESYTYHTDALGSTRLLSDSSGSVADDVRYDAWGGLLAGGASVENQYLYTGEQFDAELNKLYLRARYYSPESGRFTQMDEWPGNSVNAITLNKYAYGDLSPVNYTDPSGQFSLGEFGTAQNVRAALGKTATPQGLRSAVNNAVGTALKQSGKSLKAAAKLLRACIKKKDKCELEFNLLIVGTDNDKVRDHIASAQTVRTIVLTYMKNPDSKRGWYRNTPICKENIKPNTDCDEYPMYKTKEGGKSNYRAGGMVSLRRVPSRQNRVVGGHFGFLARNMDNKDEFVVLTSHELPTIALPIGKGGR